MQAGRCGRADVASHTPAAFVRDRAGSGSPAAKQPLPSQGFLPDIWPLVAMANGKNTYILVQSSSMDRLLTLLPLHRLGPGQPAADDDYRPSTYYVCSTALHCTALPYYW